MTDEGLSPAEKNRSSLTDATRQETIVALSTPIGRSGIGVIRLSGPLARTIADRLFRPKTASALTPYRATFGTLHEPQTDELVDEVVTTFFPGPHSYTGEDVIEFSCHGSPVILRRVIELALECGAQLARPGEFTLRAFLNGRLNLTQAEAVRDLIQAQTIYQAKVALRQLQGSLSQTLQPLKQALIHAIVHLETAVEFAEEDVTPKGRPSLIGQLDELVAQLAEIEKTFRFGRIVREGLQMAIVGKANVGKSSLFNRLLEKDRAIVTDIPGTTRDALSEAASIEGIPFTLVDTAGIRRTTDVVETIGITRSRQAIADADLVLVVLDVSQPLDEDDHTVLQETAGHPRLIVANKKDLPRQWDTEDLRSWGGDDPIISVSALTGDGMNILTREVLTIVMGGRVYPEDVILTNVRHHRLIVAAIEAVRKAVDALTEGYSEEVALVGLHEALRSLGEITGEVTVEDILDQIFSTFCIGK
jgi:tRNA modification GTPase